MQNRLGSQHPELYEGIESGAIERFRTGQALSLGDVSLIHRISQFTIKFPDGTTRGVWDTETPTAASALYKEEMAKIGEQIEQQRKESKEQTDKLLKQLEQQRQDSEEKERLYLQMQQQKEQMDQQKEIISLLKALKLS